MAGDYYPFGMLMPGRSGSLINGEWTEGGNAVLANLTVDDRNGNQPMEYVATESIEFLPGFESGNGDAFVAYIDPEAMSGSVGAGSGLYRYGFNGKENDNEVKGEGHQQDYGMRIYDGRLGKFLSVDPLSRDYPWYTPFQFSGNNPIRFIDLDGAEPAEPFKYSPAIPFFPPAKPRTPLGYMNHSLAHGVQNFQNSKAGKITSGVGNTVMGLVGTIASISYITSTDGAGAALGGSVALQLSLGEMAIGITQITEAITLNSENNQFLHNSSSIPGIIAYGSGSDYAPFIDALGQFTPTLVTSGGPAKLFSLKGLVQSGGGVIEASKTLYNSPSVFNALNLLDSYKDLEGFVLESFNLFNQPAGLGVEKGIHQLLNAKFSYTVQKGDNLTEISKKFNTPIEIIMKNNSIEEPNKISEGQKLNFTTSASGRTNGRR